MVLVMTVEPGFGGQSFMADQMPKVREVREAVRRHGGEIWVQVDGGVTADTIEQCAEAGADVFVAGLGGLRRRRRGGRRGRAAGARRSTSTSDAPRYAMPTVTLRRPLSLASGSGNSTRSPAGALQRCRPADGGTDRPGRPLDGLPTGAADGGILGARAPGSVKFRTGGDSPRPGRSQRPVDLVELQDRR